MQSKTYARNSNGVVEDYFQVRFVHEFVQKDFFMVYLMMLSVIQTILHSVTG